MIFYNEKKQYRHEKKVIKEKNTYEQHTYHKIVKHQDILADAFVVLKQAI
jgi:hypothetical protein